MKNWRKILCSYQIREGDSINIDVTSPGATIALGLMYFNTGNRAVAEWMQPPDTQYLLEFVRPDFLLLRVLAKSLILWEDIEPTKSWVSSHVPNIVYKYRLQKPTPEITQSVDLETIKWVESLFIFFLISLHTYCPTHGARLCACDFAARLTATL